MRTDPPNAMLRTVNVDRVEQELIPWLQAHLTMKGQDYLCRVDVDEDTIEQLLANGGAGLKEGYNGGERRYCCLGGASEAMIEHGEALSRVLVPMWNESGSRQVLVVHYAGENSELLSAQAQQYYGLPSDPYLLREDGTTWIPATEWNDWGKQGIVYKQDPDGNATEDEDHDAKNPESDFTDIIGGFARMAEEARRVQAAARQRGLW